MVVKTIQELYEDIQDLLKQWVYDKSEVDDLLDTKAEVIHTQNSSTVTENSSLSRIGTNANATQHEINLAINNIINTGSGEESGGSDIIVDSSWISNSTNPIQSKLIKSALENKADKNTVYTKTEIDEIIGDIEEDMLS